MIDCNHHWLSHTVSGGGGLQLECDLLVEMREGGREGGSVNEKNTLEIVEHNIIEESQKFNGI